MTRQQECLANTICSRALSRHPHALREHTSPPAFRATLAATLLLVAALPAQADLPLTDQLSFYGDVRGGYVHLRREDRDGSTYTANSDWRLRVRPGLKWQPADHWTFAARLAGRLSTDQDSSRFTMKSYLGGLDHGEASLDELYAQYQAGKHNLRLGRFQVSHSLAGVASKSLDRNDSGTMEVNWTEGLSWTYQLPDGWQTRAILEHNHRKGSSSIRRSPLDFADSDARWSTFMTVENNEQHGALVQRGASITWLPEALYSDGTSLDRHEDYWTLSTRAAMRWAIADTGSAFQLGAEAGYAPNTPRKSALNLKGSGDSKGTAWQISANWLNFVSGHSIGLIHGRAEAGWLQSPDFVSNQDLLEVRYQWKVDSNQLLEVRVRQRTDLQRPVTTEKRRDDVDFHLHYTVTF